MLTELNAWGGCLRIGRRRAGATLLLFLALFGREATPLGLLICRRGGRWAMRVLTSVALFAFTLGVTHARNALFVRRFGPFWGLRATMALTRAPSALAPLGRWRARARVFAVGPNAPSSFLELITDGTRASCRPRRVNAFTALAFALLLLILIILLNAL